MRLGPGKIHNSSRYGGFIAGVRKGVKGSQLDKKHGCRSGVLRARRWAVAAESSGWMAVCFFILRWHTPREHQFADTLSCLDSPVLVPWAKSKRWKYSSPTIWATAPLKTCLVAFVERRHSELEVIICKNLSQPRDLWYDKCNKHHYPDTTRNPRFLHLCPLCRHCGFPLAF